MSRNWETQTVVTWIDQSDSDIQMVERIIRLSDSPYEASQTLKTWYEEGLDIFCKDSNMWKDFLISSLKQVNWLSIIEDYTE